MRNFRKDFITNPANVSKQKIKASGVVLHETATPGATAAMEVKAFNSHDWRASAHAFIDWAEDVQTLPWETKGWHAKEPANSLFVGVEMCRPRNDDPLKIDRMVATYLASVNAVARVFFYVLKINNVTKENLMSHDEVRKKWKNTTHVDPTSYLKEIGKNMDMFREDVQDKLDALRG